MATSGEGASEFARRHGLQTKRIVYWDRRLSRAEPRRPRTLSLVPAMVVAADLAVVIRTGAVTIELSSATPEQIAAVAHALARPRS